MIETGAMMGGEESGGFGFGMHLPERDGIYADLLLLDLFLRERAAGRWPVSTAVAHFHEIAGPSFYLRDRRPRRPGRSTRRSKRRLLVDLAAQAPAELAGQPVARTDALDTNDGFKFFLDDGSWLLDPGFAARSRSCASTRRRPPPSCATRCSSPASGWSAARERRPGRRAARVDKPWGHELIWAHTDRYVGKILVIETGKRLSLQRHEVKDESILVLSGRLRLHLEDDDGVVRTDELGPGEHAPRRRPAASTATRRSSAASSSRSRRPSSTTSSGSRTTSAARATIRALSRGRDDFGGDRRRAAGCRLRDATATTGRGA